MTFEEWLGDGYKYLSSSQARLARTAWEVAFDAGVKWALEQDANTLNKLQLTQEKSDED